ncbi:MAG: ABC transporter ATP-binding protein/permease [Bacteriovoracaceae bacterium]|nr:ABC transporter ATP-binding protein/permease [Bacteriovoracaceae bacterium]
MESLILQEDEETKYKFSPLGLNFTKSKEWDGASSDAKWLWPWISPFKGKLLLGLCLFSIATLCAIAIPKMVAMSIDEILVNHQDKKAFWITALLSIIILKITADLNYKWIVTKAGQKMTKQLREDVFYKLGVFPLAFFDKNSSGRLISRCVNDISNLSSFFTANFFTVISDIVVVIGCVFVMASISFYAAAIVVLTLIPMAVYMLNVSQAQMRWGREMRNTLSKLSSHSADTMNNLSILHSQPFSSKWSRRHKRIQQTYVRQTTRAILIWGSFSSVHILVMGVTYAFIIAIGVHQLKNNQLTIGNFIAMCTYVALIFGPFFEISEKLNTLVTALGSAKRLRAILPQKELNAEWNEPINPLPPKGDILFRNVHFHYREDKSLFKDLTLTLPEGEVTALVGRTGSGKTTLAHLILSLYPIQSGTIFWGEENLCDIGAMRRSRWISHVSQDLFLFTDTLRENIRLWREEIQDEQIIDRLKRVGLWDKAQSLKGGLDMVVKAETLPFSQGEKQLLLLCRALLQDPRLLVFDEATANLDQLSEEEWLKHIDELFQGRTTLFIAHRLETLRLATQIIVLEYGVVKKIIKKPKGEAIREEDLH